MFKSLLFQIFNASITKEQTVVFMMVEEEGRRQTDLPMEVRRLADLPVEGRRLADLPVEGRRLTDLSLDGRRLADLPVEGRRLTDLSVEGRRLTHLSVEGRRLADLPVEILLHIFQFLEVKFITEVLASVCSLFRCGQYGYKL